MAYKFQTKDYNAFGTIPFVFGLIGVLTAELAESLIFEHDLFGHYSPLESYIIAGSFLLYAGTAIVTNWKDVDSDPSAWSK